MKLDRLYTLAPDGKTPIAVKNMIEWVLSFDPDEFEAIRKVANTVISDDPRIEVSTVFIGIDYNIGRSGPPLLWETMIFGGKHDRWATRYPSHDDAVRGHEAAVALAAEGTAA